MANSIALAEKYQPLLDEVYKTASKTIDLESAPVLFDGAQTVKVLKVTLDPPSNYSRNSGFTDGSLTARQVLDKAVEILKAEADEFSAQVDALAQ